MEQGIYNLWRILIHFQRALRVAQIAQEGYGNRLADGYPYLEAEVVYAVQEEMAVSAVDVLARRTRLAFLDTEAAALCMDRVISILDNTLEDFNRISNRISYYNTPSI
jgi:glycerol-3-phosphate dehydrogenase